VLDPRGAQGSRDDLWQILLIIIMGIMSGHTTYRDNLPRIREICGETSTHSDQDTSPETRYISFLPPTSERIAKVIRGHWQVENRLHWVKDVIFDEDKSPQKAGNAPINLSIIKTWVLSVFRLHGFDSIKGAIDRFSDNIPAMWSLLI